MFANERILHDVATVLTKNLLELVDVVILVRTVSVTGLVTNYLNIAARIEEGSAYLTRLVMASISGSFL